MRPQNILTSGCAQQMAAIRWRKHRDILPPPQKPDLAKQAARAAGLSKFIGSRCKHGHSGIRYTSTGQCVDCIPMYRQLNKEKTQ